MTTRRVSIFASLSKGIRVTKSGRPSESQRLRAAAPGRNKRKYVWSHDIPDNLRNCGNTSTVTLNRVAGHLHVVRDHCPFRNVRLLTANRGHCTNDLVDATSSCLRKIRYRVHCDLFLPPSPYAFDVLQGLTRLRPSCFAAYSRSFTGGMSRAKRSYGHLRSEDSGRYLAVGSVPTGPARSFCAWI